MDLTIDKPELKIQDLIKKQQEKENIETIYKEIKKETQVLGIKEEKDKEWGEIEKNLKDHKKSYSDFVNNIPKEIEKIKQRPKGRSRRGSDELLNRYSIDIKYEESSAANKISKTKKEEKEAVIEFYKSYVRALDKSQSLSEKLQKIETNIPKKEAIILQNFQTVSQWLEKFNSSSPIIDLSSKNNQDKPPQDLLSDNLHNLMKKKFQSWEEDINWIEEGIEIKICNFTTLPYILVSGGQNPCYNKTNWLRENQETLQQAIDFKVLIKLLKDMKQTRVNKFDIEYEEEEKYNWPIFWQTWKENRFYFLN